MYGPVGKHDLLYGFGHAFPISRHGVLGDGMDSPAATLPKRRRGGSSPAAAGHRVREAHHGPSPTESKSGAQTAAANITHPQHVGGWVAV